MGLISWDHPFNNENLKNEYKFEISRDSKKGSNIADLDQLTRYRKSWCNSMGSEIATCLGWKSGRKCRWDCSTFCRPRLGSRPWHPPVANTKHRYSIIVPLLAAHVQVLSNPSFLRSIVPLLSNRSIFRSIRSVSPFVPCCRSIVVIPLSFCCYSVVMLFYERYLPMLF